MYKLILTISLLFLLQESSNGQNTNTKKQLLSITGGRVAFGTGDILGLGIGVTYGRELNNNKNKLSKLIFETEVIFENGSITPKIENITIQDFNKPGFRHSTNVILNPKITWHPATNKYLNGLYLSLGPTLGYTWQSREKKATMQFDGIQSNRVILLDYKNKFIGGYRINLGYDIELVKKYFFGVRVDFSNNNLADINTFAAIKFGKIF